MRILVVTNLYPNAYQPGKATWNRQQIRALAARHPLAVVSPIAWTDEWAARWQGAAALPPGRRVVCDGIPVDHPRYLHSPKVLRGWYGHFFRRCIRRSFDRAVSEFRPDIAFASWAYPDGWAAVDLARRVGLPVVIKVHGCDILCGGRGLDHYPSRKRPTVAALREADGVVAVSQDLAEHVIALGVDPGRVRVVYNGINASLFHPGSQEAARASLGLDRTQPLILFVGNLVAVKGVDVLIEACARLSRAGQVLACRLIGQGPLKQKLERHIVRRGLQEPVKLVGPVAHHLLPDWFRAATVCVLPSRSEGVPNVLLEAAACGTPFIASRVGGIPEIAHLGQGQLVPAGDPDCLAQAIGSHLAGANRPAQESARFPRSQEQVASELESFLEEVLQRRRGSARRGTPAGGAPRPANVKDRLKDRTP